MKKRRPVSVLPAHRPKKTGKAGIGPKEFPGDLTEQDAARSAQESAPPEPEQGKEPLQVPPANGVKKKPKQARLPEMDDEKIEELEAAAEEYADIRDQRMALTPQEDQLKKELLAAMKRFGKRKYVRDGIKIDVVSESETVKVKIKKTGED
jgi:hypothetical protein